MNRRFIATLVLFGFTSSHVRADALDDFRKTRDLAIAEYDRIVKASVQQTRDIALPNFASLNIRFSRGLMFEDFAELEKTANDLGAQAENVSKLEGERSSRIEELLEAPLGLSGFDSFINELTGLALSVERAKSLEAQFKSVVQSVNQYKANTESICPLAISMMNAGDLVFPPPQSIAPESPNLRLVHPWQFGSDELGRAAFLVTVSSSVAVSIMMFIVNYGVSAFVKLFATGTLFVNLTGDAVIAGASTTVGGAAASGSSGSASGAAGGSAFSTFTGILAIAAFIAMVVVELQNEKKEKEAKEAVQKLYQRFEEIRAWYLANRVSESEVQEKVKAICEKEYQSSVDGRKGVIFEAQEAVDRMDKASNANLAQVTSLRITLEENKGNYEKALAQYQATLALTLSQDFLKDHRAAVLSQAKAASAWEHFNEVIKPRWTEYTRFYAANLKNCPLLAQKSKEVKLGIDVHLQMINDQLDVHNSDKAQWSEIRSIAMDLQKRIDGRAATCKISDDEVIPDDIPLF